MARTGTRIGLMSNERSRLQRQILDVIAAAESTASEGDVAAFDSLACAVFAYQFENNPPYRRLCERRAVQPAQIRTWRDIPPVMANSFKHAAFFCGTAAEAACVFETSGTSSSRRGRHYMADTELYRTGALATFRNACLPDFAKLPILLLGPSADLFPNSSLGAMYTWILEAHGTADSQIAFSPRGIRFSVARDWLDRSAAPVLVLATSLALLDLDEAAEAVGRTWRLPEGSRILDTGGYKNDVRQTSREALLERLSARLGVPEAWIFNEYGMTELSSQFYNTRFTAGDGTWAGPPWLRAVACDPATLDILPDGEQGLLRFFDLANLDSVSMIQTEDLGRVTPEGLELTGRASGAELRGCSALGALVSSA